MTPSAEGPTSPEADPPGVLPRRKPGYVPGEAAAGEEDPGASIDTPPDQPETRSPSGTLNPARASQPPRSSPA